MEDNHSIYPDKYPIVKENLTVQITLEQLKAIFPQASKNTEAFIPFLNEYMPKYGINTTERISMFIAQAGHESGQFKYTREIWGPTTQQKRYERDFTATWSANNSTNKLAYQLGNDEVGDGSKYRGRGIFQTTGKANYKSTGEHLGIDLVNSPELLEQPQYAVQSACYFWTSRKLNRFADADDIAGCTVVINGGQNGLIERTQFYDKAKQVLVS